MHSFNEEIVKYIKEFHKDSSSLKERLITLTFQEYMDLTHIIEMGILSMDYGERKKYDDEYSALCNKVYEQFIDSKQ